MECLTTDEIWKDIQGYEGLYTISSDGQVYSCVTDQSRRRGVISPHIKNGYLAVNLYKDGKCKHHYVHRLVAHAFICNINDYRYVNHIDANKHNNRVENLEWCSQKQNIDHSIKHGLQHRRYKTIVNGVEYPTIREASMSVFGNNWYIRYWKSKLGNSFFKDGYVVIVVGGK